MKLDIKHSEPSDEYIIKQTPKEYSCISDFLENAVVLDIGAHIGCFSMMALSLGAVQVVSVEPIPISVAHLRKNLEFAKDRSIIIEAAAVGSSTDDITMRWLNATWRSRPSNDSRVTWRGRDYQFAHVKTVRFLDLLETYKPNLIKFDCEGAEYDLLQSIAVMPDCVHTLTIEWHKFTPDAFDRTQTPLVNEKIWRKM